jgi:hypothetical protein
VGAALLALSASFCLGSCVADSVSLRVTCAVVPETDCTYTTSGLCFLQGAINLSAARSYSAVVRVTNGLKPRARDVPPMSEPNGVQVNEIEVHVTDSAGREPAFPKALPNPFTVTATGFADPGEEALVGAELLPPAYVSQIATMFAAKKLTGSVRLAVIVRGRTSGDVDVESGEWHWNVQLRTVDTNPDGQECQPFTETVCTYGQDAWVNACNPALVTTTK